MQRIIKLSGYECTIIQIRPVRHVACACSWALNVRLSQREANKKAPAHCTPPYPSYPSRKPRSEFGIFSWHHWESDRLHPATVNTNHWKWVSVCSSPVQRRKRYVQTEKSSEFTEREICPIRIRIP